MQRISLDGANILQCAGPGGDADFGVAGYRPERSVAQGRTFVRYRAQTDPLKKLVPSSKFV